MYSTAKLVVSPPLAKSRAESTRATDTTRRVVEEERHGSATTHCRCGVTVKHKSVPCVFSITSTHLCHRDIFTCNPNLLRVSLRPLLSAYSETFPVEIVRPHALTCDPVTHSAVCYVNHKAGVNGFDESVNMCCSQFFNCYLQWN